MFSTLLVVEDVKRRIMFHDTSKLHEIEILMPINVVFLNTTMSIPLHAAYGCFCTALAKLSLHNRDHMVCRVYNIYYRALYRKKIANPCPGGRKLSI